MRSKETFYSSLTGRKINDKKQERVFNVSKKFEMKTIKYCRDFYLKCDILFLADVFEKFTKKSLKKYGLCPSHYLSASDLNWDAMLKVKKIKVGVILDPSMFIFFKKGARVGISNRYSKSNNKF